jgi:hypothetical protein
MTDLDIQELLRLVGAYNGRIDGILGPKSRAAINSVLIPRPEAQRWPLGRRKIAAAQEILNRHGFEAGPVDGWLGHNTNNAFEAWRYKSASGVDMDLARDADPVASGVGRWPRQGDVEKVFGAAGSPRATAGRCKLPVPFVIAWNPSQVITGFACHELVAEPITSLFGEAVRHYGEREFRRLRLDRFGGCYNNRAMRGGSRKSMHAYGIAVDLDPENNRLRWGSDRAAFAGAEYDAWWEIVRRHGGVSLGQARNFDWMHFQFARL